MNDFSEVIKNSKPTLVDFYATWCGPCKMMHPILDKLKENVGDAVSILKIDVDKNQELSAQYRIQSVPTLMIFKDGEIKWRSAGVHQADALESKLKEFISRCNAAGRSELARGSLKIIKTGLLTRRF